jgi:(S)-2-hydroxyglutarate dehydrogenase
VRNTGKRRVVIVGGGILGLSIAHELSSAGQAVTVLEKEKGLALHQTGRNSGVIHAGPYYTPGSLKARLCGLGNRLMVDFARQESLPHEITGKLLLATTSSEVGLLGNLAHRAKANGVPAELISAGEITDIEPFASGLAALHVKNTGIIDYRSVSDRLAEKSKSQGAEIVTSAEVTAISQEGRNIVVEHTQGSHTGALLINAAGLYSDRIAIMAGITPDVRIIPFRGEYFELSDEAAVKVKGLIYPVPNPKFPFLGVHLTKMIGGGVHAGPNAVLALSREGYTWSSLIPRELWLTLSFPGFARLALKNVGTGLREIARSASKRMFARDLSRLVPGINPADLIPSPAGVRAQAIRPDGTLADDFIIHRTQSQVHILNAPSPAATASLAIAKHLVSSLFTEMRA